MYPSLGAVLELLKPITWFAPMWAFACGLVSMRAGAGSHWTEALAGILLAGPLICATSQAVNDWFDRHVDAINEPGRPIPSGRIPGSWGLYIALLWTALSVLVAALLGVWVFCAAAFGLLLAWLYSAPPVRLKRNGWLGNSAVAICYEGVPWVAGATVMAAGAVPGWHVLALAGIYSAGAHGIMTLNDFKSVGGDRRMGIHSLPVLLGVVNASRVACIVMALAQAAVIALLLLWGKALFAALVAMLLIAQLALMTRLLRDPREQAPWYNATGTTLYVLGMLAGAFALRTEVMGAHP